MFHNLNARTITVVSEDDALPRSDQELLGTMIAEAPSCYPVELIFTPQVPSIQVDMYPTNERYIYIYIYIYIALVVIPMINFISSFFFGY